jgi:hypothetical protein
MRKLLLVSGTALVLATGPALAQTMPATPPVAPDAAAPAAPGMTGIRAMRGQVRESVRPYRAAPASTKQAKFRTTHRAPASQAQASGIDTPRTGDYRGGAGSPSSAKASNIGR